ncbi:MAG: CapA family protein [Candidatus Cloacimonetes bacterium]|nr:CapA family protein [Candidatus Cloacimonadota bacterium]
MIRTVIVLFLATCIPCACAWLPPNPAYITPSAPPQTEIAAEQSTQPPLATASEQVPPEPLPEASEPPPGTEPPVEYEPPPEPPRHLTVAAVGDIMLGTDFPEAHYLPSADGRGLLDSALIELLASADVALGNLEGVFCDGGEPRLPNKTYSFRMPPRLAPRLAEWGFDFVSLANNHARDFGDDGCAQTIAALQAVGIVYAGLEEHPTAVLRRNGLRVGFAAFAPNAGTVNFHRQAEARRIVAALADSCDIVLVSVHGGAEGADALHVPREEEMYLGENRGDIYAFARLVIDAGADAVFAHGPHVPRALDLYNERIIAYSLGNFCTPARFNLSGTGGLAPLLLVELDEAGRFVSGQLVSCRQAYGRGPRLDDTREAAALIGDLTREDIPEAPLRIEADGRVWPVVE